ncbi:hypothetical protein PC120_g14440 [Phytophthora cactorum]|nr:hypothetical protein PC120_g14440 [Phytophthora cactorum]
MASPQYCCPAADVRQRAVGERSDGAVASIRLGRGACVANQQTANQASRRQDRSYRTVACATEAKSGRAAAEPAQRHRQDQVILAIRSCMQLAVCYGPELPLGDDSEQDRGLHTLAPALHVIHGPKRILMEHDWTVASATTGCLVSHDSWRAGGACA